MSFGERIEDEFTDLRLTKQRKWQLRQRAKGLCMKCKNKATKGDLCDFHRFGRRVSNIVVPEQPPEPDMHPGNIEDINPVD